MKKSSTTLSKIKIATEEDFDLILKHSKEFASCLKQRNHVEESKLRQLINNFLTSPKEEKIILLHGKEGMLVACINPFLLGSTPVANEIAWWVVPEARKKNVGKELIEAFEYWAQKLNCTHMVLACYADNDLGKFYERMGYTLHEKSYCKEVN